MAECDTAASGGGPHGIGDPNDKSLRRVEKEVLIPKIMRERTKNEKCYDLVQEWGKCVKANGLMMVVRCRKENDIMQECTRQWYTNEDFVKECTEIYLNERSEYRRTGIPKKKRETA